jgi:hypothetical protein
MMWGNQDKPPFLLRECIPLLFVFTSDEESSEYEDEDLTFIPHSTPERSQPRPRKSNPSLPTSREVVIGLPASGSGASYHGSRGKGKEAEVKGKGKGKVE